jgi:hypothetical protein
VLTTPLLLPVCCPHTHQVDFPSIGQLLRNRAGRIEFVFEPLLVEELELGVEPVRGAGGGHTLGGVDPHLPVPVLLPGDKHTNATDKC